MKYFFIIIFLFPISLFAQKQGQALIDSLLKELPKQKEDTNKVKVLNTISGEYRYINADEGIKYGQQSLVLAEKLQWKKGKARANQNLGLNYEVKSDHPKALENYTIALKLFEEIGDKQALAKVTGNIGVVYCDLGDYPRALEYYFQALKMAEEIKDTHTAAINIGNIAIVYDEQGDLPRALEYYFKALKMAEEMQDKNAEARNTSNIGILYSVQGDYPRALEYFLKALKLAEEIGNKQLAANTTGSIGIVYNARRDYPRALEYHFKALKMGEEMGDKDGVARTVGNISDVYTHQKNYIMAIAYGKKALELDEEIGAQHEVAYALAAIGLAYLALAQDSGKGSRSSFLSEVPAGVAVAVPSIPTGKAARLRIAIAYLQHDLEVGKKINVLEVVQGCYEGLAKAYKTKGDYKKALENYQEYMTIQDSAFSVANKTKIANLEHQRELDLKESRIKLLEQENKIKDLNAQKEKLIRKIMGGGIIMIIILAGMMAYYFVRRQQNEKRIANERINTLLKDQELRSVSDMLDAQEGERNRIASDLHDRLGSMLSTVKLYFNSVEEQIGVMKEQNRNQYHKATSLLDEACDEVRKISHDLVSGELVKFGLVPALSQLKETIENTGKLKMQVLAFGMEKRLEGNVEISLYRVVQELMNNILKHSKADHVTIQLNKAEGNLNIVVEDNGVGFDVAAARQKDGIGLKNLETRINKLSGSIFIDSGRGRGTTTIIDIPVLKSPGV